MPTTHRSRLAGAALTLAVASLSASAVAAQVTTSSGGDVTAFSQKQLIDHMIVSDSMELQLAALATSRTQNAAVRDFANQLIADHKAHLDNLLKLAGNANIGREANTTDSTGRQAANTFKSLQSMAADSGFDRAFVQAQIQAHQSSINTLKAIRPTVKDADVQKDIDATLPVLESHLSKATQLASQLGSPRAAGAAGAADSASTKTKPPVATPPAAKPPV
jgi:putative membrane protein